MNGSLGRVVDFITPDEAFEQHVEIAKVDERKTPRGRPMRTSGEGTSSQAAIREECRCKGKAAECKCSVVHIDGENRWPVVEFTSGERLVLR